MSENEKILADTKTDVAATPTPLRMQYVFVTLADGRRGAFCGPELIGKAELLLKPPTLVDIVFSEPKEMTAPVTEEVPSADTKVDEAPVVAPSDSGQVAEKS